MRIVIVIITTILTTLLFNCFIAVRLENADYFDSDYNCLFWPPTYQGELPHAVTTREEEYRA